VTRSFTIITTYASPDVAELRDRTPVILEPADWPVWLGETPGNSTAAPLAHRPGARLAGRSACEQPEE
jgi:putative SOS response-associated peptidase YedK